MVEIGLGIIRIERQVDDSGFDQIQKEIGSIPIIIR
jgi:hypothetical protein